MRFLLFIFIFIVTTLRSFAQYGNEWINYSQNYFKFPIYKEGIYRIDSTTLAQQFNLSTVNPKNFQLFIKGKEQFLFVKGDADNKINTNDFIEFYASPAMSDVDSLVYSHIKYLPNRYAPMFNDTIFAFLTLNNSINNSRYSLEIDTNSVLFPSANYFYNEKIFTNCFYIFYLA